MIDFEQLPTHYDEAVNKQPSTLLDLSEYITDLIKAPYLWLKSNTKAGLVVKLLIFAALGKAFALNLAFFDYLTINRYIEIPLWIAEIINFLIAGFIGGYLLFIAIFIVLKIYFYFQPESRFFAQILKKHQLNPASYTSEDYMLAKQIVENYETQTFDELIAKHPEKIVELLIIAKWLLPIDGKLILFVDYNNHQSDGILPF